MFRVEHFEHRGRRVPSEVRSHLVDLIEQEDRIFAFRLLQSTDDSSWHRTDIRTTVPTDFRLITYPTKRDTNEVTFKRRRDGAGERRLPDPWRSGETEDWSTKRVRQLTDGQILKDTVFYRFQAVMVIVEDVRRMFHVKLVFRLNAPWKRGNPVEVVTDDRIFWRRLRHNVQSFRFTHDVFSRRLWQVERL